METPAALSTSLYQPPDVAVVARKDRSSQPLAYLRVQVLSAANLTPKDRNGKADPYVVVSLPALAALHSNTYRRKTAAVSKTLDPQWKNEIWDFPITDQWFGSSGYQAGQEQSSDDMDGTTEAVADVHIDQDQAAAAAAAAHVVEVPAIDAHSVTIPVNDASQSNMPSRPQPARRNLSSAAIKVLSTSAKGVKLLPRSAAAGARAIARATPRPTYLRRGTGSRSVLQNPSLSLCSNLEIVLWDQDWGGRREYMGEANWPIWEWIRSPRRVEWSDEADNVEKQSTWLTLVSSRQSTAVSGQVQVRLGLVSAPDSPVKSLDHVYRTLVAAAVGTARPRDLVHGATVRRPRPHSILAATEEQMKAGVRAVPAAQSVGTGGEFFEDDGLSSEDDGVELLDSDSDDSEDSESDSNDDDVYGASDSAGDYTATEGEDDDPLAKHKARLMGAALESSGRDHATQSLATSPGSLSAAQSPLLRRANSDLEVPRKESEASSSRKNLLAVLGRKAKRQDRGGSPGQAAPVADADAGQDYFSPQSNAGEGRLRIKRPTRTATANSRGESEAKESRKLSKRLRRQSKQEAKRQRRAKQQEYSFKSGSDIKGIVMMEISGARDLPRWRNSLRVGFDMDPFTIVAFGQKVFRTRVLRHTLNPTWDEKLLYHVRKGEDNFNIQMSIYDWDKISANDHVGSCSLPIATLLEAAPKPDSETGLYDAAYSLNSELPMFQLPLTRNERDEEVKFGPSTPVLTIKAKYTPYAALRQRFWRTLISQFDTNDSQSLSSLELTSMLDSLGSTLTSQTIQAFFTSNGKNPDEDELTIDEAIIALEAEVNRSPDQKRHSSRGPIESGEPDRASPALPMIEGERRPSDHQPMDVRGPCAPATDASAVSSAALPVPASSRVQPSSLTTTESGQDVNAPGLTSPLPLQQQNVMSKSPELYSSATRPARLSPASPNTTRPLLTSKHSSSSTSPSPARSFSSSDVLSNSGPPRSHSTSTHAPGHIDGQDDLPVERVVLLKTCPLCHMPRLSRKGDGDVITHLAVCASQDWRRVDSLVVRNFVTSDQAHRKFIRKVVINATQGAYKLGANSANLIVQDRQTGELLEEKMQVYVRLGIRLLYQGARSRMEGARVKKMLKNMSIKQGRRYDSTASAKEIAGFIAFHNLNVDEIRDPLESFKTFNEFFYRKLKADARPIEEPKNPKRLVSSADCRMMAFDSVDSATKIWIKGREFSVERLLGDTFKGKVEGFKNGSLCIFRLAPQDYHRFHCPADATVGEPVWIEGQYYTVNCMAIRSTIDVYGENVRVVVPFHSETFGTFYAINIGAMLVASIHITVQAGQKVKKGDEMGYYAFGGSTTVCVFEKGKVIFDEDILNNSRASIETLVKQGTGIGRAEE